MLDQAAMSWYYIPIIICCFICLYRIAAGPSAPDRSRSSRASRATSRALSHVRYTRSMARAARTSTPAASTAMAVVVLRGVTCGVPARSAPSTVTDPTRNASATPTATTRCAGPMAMAGARCCHRHGGSCTTDVLPLASSHTPGTGSEVQLLRGPAAVIADERCTQTTQSEAGEGAASRTKQEPEDGPGRLDLFS